MTIPIVPMSATHEPLEAFRFYAWRDFHGREHPAIPRCVGEGAERIGGRVVH